jgi:hypothetical protein
VSAGWGYFLPKDDSFISIFGTFLLIFVDSLELAIL